MTAQPAPPAAIESYHAHVYFDAESRDAAQGLRDAIVDAFPVEMGRWHEKPVGPHPRWSYQVAFAPELFDALVPWLMVNRNGLTIFLHPNTGDDLADHRDHPAWMGEQVALNLGMFEKD